MKFYDCHIFSLVSGFAPDFFYPGQISRTEQYHCVINNNG